MNRTMSLTVFSLMLTALSLISFQALSDESTEKTLDDVLVETGLPENWVKYAPENCDFQAYFPSEPSTMQKCPTGAPKSQCYNMISYNMVYETQTAVEFNVTCSPLQEGEYDRYNQAVISTALKGMIADKDLKEQSGTTTQKENYRVGSIVGTRMIGLQQSIYTAQLWLGKNSLMTVESSLVGPSMDIADETFSDFLKNVKKKED